jgi:hypothetical protein
LNLQNSLLEFIRTVDGDRPILLRHVLSEYLKAERMPVFLGFLAPSDLDPLIWSSLCCRLLLSVAHAQSAASSPCSCSLTGDETDPKEPKSSVLIRLSS